MKAGSDNKGFISQNRVLILLLLVSLLGFYAFHTARENYHKKEVKALETQIKAKEKDFKKAVEEKVKLQDSSVFYEQAAQASEAEAQFFKNEADRYRVEKEKAVKALANIPKSVIDSFLDRRYKKVPRSKVNVVVDKNVGNEIVMELVEKDYISKELDIKYQENSVLDSQVFSLKTSLSFSKAALVQADSAIVIRTQQLDLSQQSNKLLKEDLGTAKKKAFWNKWKGGGVGLTLGIIITLILL